MSEFSSRVDAQRQLVRAVNNRGWKREQLFALSSGAINRWASANGVDFSSTLMKLLFAASEEIFVMANHSDDAIAGAYAITRNRVAAIEEQVRIEVASPLYN